MSRGGAQSEQLQGRGEKNVEGIIQKEEKGIMAKKGVATWGTELGANELPSPGPRDGGVLYS